MRKEGELGVYTGSSRQGKTAALKQHIKRHRRVIVWSVKETVDRYGEVWQDSVRARTLPELKAAIMRAGKGAAHIIYTPQSLKDFEGWARAAHAWGIIAPCSVVAEELADVTTPGKAPDGWGNLVRQGLGWGINIYAVTQRPSESDKTAIGNASYLHCHFMMREQDRVYMAREMNIQPGDLGALKKLEWIERWADRTVKRGRVKF